MLKFLLGLFAGLIIALNFPQAPAAANAMARAGGAALCRFAESEKCSTMVLRMFSPADEMVGLSPEEMVAAPTGTLSRIVSNAMRPAPVRGTPVE